MAEAGVVTNKTTETSVAEIQAKQEAPRVTVVTNDNFDQYVEEKLGPRPQSPEEKAAAEHAKVEAEKAAKKETEKPAETDVEQEAGVSEHLPKEKKGKLNERFSELTAKRKEAEERAEKSASEAKAAREAREQAEAQVAALKAKYEPVKTDPDPEPQPSQFTDINEYTKAIKEWSADNARREDAKKAQEAAAKADYDKTVKAWAEKQAATRTEIPDYESVISSAGDVKVSDQVRDAILESDNGPKILYHLAKNPDLATKIGQMTVGRALREIGKLDATLGTKDAAPQKEAKTTVAEISKAPAPISPLKPNSAPVITLSGHDQVPNSMSYEDWKALRKSGKIR